jgi:hypothetical protein
VQVEKERLAEEASAAMGLAPHVKAILEKPLGSYAQGQKGTHDMMKAAKNALRAQMAFEGVQTKVRAMVHFGFADASDRLFGLVNHCSRTPWEKT